MNGTTNYLQGNFSVSPTNYSGSTELNPVRDALGVVTSTMTVTFNGKLAATAVPTMTANGSGLTGSNPSLVVQDYANGSSSGFKPYVDGGGAWQLANISFNGDASTSGGLGIVVNPVPAVTAAESHPVDPHCNRLLRNHSSHGAVVRKWQPSTEQRRRRRRHQWHQRYLHRQLAVHLNLYLHD